jgi:hypothetical protein
MKEEKKQQPAPPLFLKSKIIFKKICIGTPHPLQQSINKIKQFS